MIGCSADVMTLPRTPYAGVDVGGTKVLMYYWDPATGALAHVEVRAARYGSLEDALCGCFVEAGCRPDHLVAGVAGRVVSGGDVQVTNRPHWPIFRRAPFVAAYDLEMSVVNDLVATAIGTGDLGAGEYRELLAGAPRSCDGARLVVAIGTGVGAAVVDADGRVRPTEAGHIGWQPVTEEEWDLLRFLRAEFPAEVITVEWVLGGLVGFHGLYQYMATRREPSRALHAVAESATETGLGPSITAAAQSGDEFCRDVLRLYGAVLGQFLRDVMLVSLPEGGEVWLGGSVLQAPGVCDFLLADSPLLKRMSNAGAPHADLLARTALLLIADRHVAARGALLRSRLTASPTG